MPECMTTWCLEQYSQFEPRIMRSQEDWFIWWWDTHLWTSIPFLLFPFTCIHSRVMFLNKTGQSEVLPLNHCLISVWIDFTLTKWQLLRFNGHLRTEDICYIRRNLISLFDTILLVWYSVIRPGKVSLQSHFDLSLKHSKWYINNEYAVFSQNQTTCIIF